MLVGLLSIIPIMNNLLEQRFFRLLSEYSQRKVSASEFTEAIEELATHLADFSLGTVVKRIKLYNELIANAI